MSKTYLLSDKYSSAKDSKGEYFGQNENMLPSISNSFIKKQSSQMNNVIPSKQYQNTMPLSYSKKISDIKENNRQVCSSISSCLFIMHILNFMFVHLNTIVPSTINFI